MKFSPTVVATVLAIACTTTRLHVTGFTASYPHAPASLSFCSRKSYFTSSRVTGTVGAPRPPHVLHSSDDNFWEGYDSFTPPTPERNYSGNGRDDEGRRVRQGRGGDSRSYNDNRGGGRGQRRGRGGGGYQYTRDTSRDNSNVDEVAVLSLLQERSDAKRKMDYERADAIRDDLLTSYSVGVNDRERSWRTGASRSGSGRKFGGGGSGGGRGGRQRRQPRDFGPNGHDYEQSADAGPNSSSFSIDDINGMLAERLQAKMSRSFHIADGIQTQLINGGVYVHDGMKEWRADGIPYGDVLGGRGGGPGKTFGSRSQRNQPYAKSAHSESLDNEELVQGLVDKRIQFKQFREYDKADAVRDGLESKFNVIIDDRLREWSVGGDFGPDHNAQRDLAFAFAKRGYVKSNSSLDLGKEEEEDIQRLIDERAVAKNERDFGVADDIRDVIFEKYDVTINDKMKLWSAGGFFEELGMSHNKKTPRGVYTKRGSAGNLTDDDVATIDALLMERFQAKKARDFDTADGIRDDLWDRFSVKVDDKASEWRIETDEYFSVGANNLSEEDVEYITSKITERFNCKQNKEYESADDIRDALYDRYGITIDDRNKEWKVEGNFNADPQQDLTTSTTATQEPVPMVDEDTTNDVSDGKTDVDDDLDKALESFFDHDTDFSIATSTDETITIEENTNDDITLNGNDNTVAVQNERINNEEGEEHAQDDSEGENEDDLTCFTVPQLKEKLRAAGLPVSGKKAELIERLVSS